MQPASTFAGPQRGWIRAIRDALGMSAAQLGRRMGVSQAAVADLERTERLGTIRLSSLTRAAASMDCQLVYAFIPNERLEAAVRTQAARIVARHADSAHQSMVLEAQGDYAFADDDSAISQLMDSPRLWEES